MDDEDELAQLLAEHGFDATGMGGEDDEAPPRLDDLGDWE